MAGVLSSMVLLALAGYGIGYYELPSALIAHPASPWLLRPCLTWCCAISERSGCENFNRHLPEAIDLMSRALRAGHSLTAAIEIVGEECPEPVRSEFREVYRQQNFGLPAREALVRAGRIAFPCRS